MVAADGDRLRAMWYLVLATGLRRAELAGLRWRDVALDRVPPALAVRTTRTTAGHAGGRVRPQEQVEQAAAPPRHRDGRITRDHCGAMAAEAEKRGESRSPSTSSWTSLVTRTIRLN